jgi:hypothetical protein
LYELGSYSLLAMRRGDVIGMAAAALHDASNGIMTTWGMLAGEWALLMVAAWYLEQVCVCLCVRAGVKGEGYN